MTVTIEIELTDDYKKQAIQTIMDTIDKVCKNENIKLNASEVRRIKNLSLDQINVNVTHKNKLKTMWVFDMENKYPVTLEHEDTFNYSKNKNKAYYKLKNNGDWEITEDPADFDKETFEIMALENLIADFETAAFYGTASYGSDGYGK